jgi:GT2 family glycosyltransferase
MTVDVVIISLASTKALLKMTEAAIQSLHESEPLHDFNVIVVEGNKYVSYKGATTIHYSGDYNYNALLNLGTSYGKSDWVVWANNDLIFHEGWFTEILEGNKQTSIESWGSLSPGYQHQEKGLKGDRFQIGTRIGIEMSGWCITLHRSVWERIGQLHTHVMHHYSDQVYLDQIAELGITHALATQSRVTHLLNKTIKELPVIDQRKYCEGQRVRYNNLKSKK